MGETKSKAERRAEALRRTTVMGDAPAAARPCHRDGCPGEGSYRAPASPDRLDNYLWFCLDHVREYNKAWNYCAGRSEAEIEAMIREDIVGWRPTWPLGLMGGYFNRARFDRLCEEFGLNGADGAADGRDKGGARAGRHNGADGPIARALDIFELRPPVTVSVLKAQYKVLVKRHHPDANGGDKSAEERLKLINEAYATLKESFGA